MTAWSQAAGAVSPQGCETDDDGEVSDLSPELLVVLAPATDAARRALARLDDEDVPAVLKRTAAYSGGRLPPPLLRQLVGAIADDEQFREKVVREMGDGETPAHAFVRQESGWWAEVAAAAVAIGVRDARAERSRIESRLDKAQSALAEAKRRAKAASRRVAGTSDVEDKGRLQAAEKARAAAEKAAERAVAEAHQSESAAAAALEEARADLALTQQQVGRLRRRLVAMRGSGGGETMARQGLTRDPLELAKHLDLLAVLSNAASRGSGASADPRDGGQARQVLPPGIAPDSVAAIQWLIDRGDRYSLVVDGYNVTYLVNVNGFASTRARLRLNHDLARLRRQASAAPRIIVVYDSTLAGERDVESSTGGVEVRFAPDDRLADEEIVALAQELPGPVVVVSTDREVREQAEAAGAVALWSQALVAWMRTAG